MITLVLEASTYAGSVALLRGVALQGARSVAMRGREHEALMPAVADLLDECSVEPRHLSRVVCGDGPGSFTSLRIAASITKGLSHAVGAVLVPVSSLALMVASVQPPLSNYYLAAIDAMRGEHYVQLFEVPAAAELRTAGPLMRVPSDSVDHLAQQLHAVAVGPDRAGAFAPHASGAARLTNMIESSVVADLAGWEPMYGRLAEAQVKWEAVHGRPLQVG